jgi:hypothetical protein
MPEITLSINNYFKMDNFINKIKDYAANYKNDGLRKGISVEKEANQSQSRLDKKQGLPFESLERMRKKLIDYGFEKNDIEISLSLMVTISFFDRLIFPENHAQFNFNPDNNDGREEFVCFDELKIGEMGRRYEIFPQQIKSRFDIEKNKRVSFFDANNKLKLEKCLNNNIFFLTIAAHEARHRYVKEGLSERFSPKDAARLEQGALKEVIIYKEILFRRMEEQFRREKRSDEFIKKRLHPDEFDAEVIAMLALSELNKIVKEKGKIEKKDYEQIATIIKITPSESARPDLIRKLRQKILKR